MKLKVCLHNRINRTPFLGSVGLNLATKSKLQYFNECIIFFDNYTDQRKIILLNKEINFFIFRENRKIKGSLVNRKRGVG